MSLKGTFSKAIKKGLTQKAYSLIDANMEEGKHSITGSAQHAFLLKVSYVEEEGKQSVSWPGLDLLNMLISSKMQI